MVTLLLFSETSRLCPPPPNRVIGVPVPGETTGLVPVPKRVRSALARAARRAAWPPATRAMLEPPLATSVSLPPPPNRVVPLPATSESLPAEPITC